ncbi:hypothetical protein [Streptomyces sp. NPDC018693]|uniref:hypothetical protein n=1 Tax=unclassified Streptomyces TaxID=2593676 RepID=UPI00379CD56D
MKIRKDVAQMLQQGATFRQITAQLGVSKDTVTATRKALGMPPRCRTGLTADELAARAERRHPQITAMIRAGAPTHEITAATGAHPSTIYRVRVDLGLPARRPGRHPRTLAQSLATYTQPYGDGHARWTGALTDKTPTVYTDGRNRSARREIFRLHHGRPPQGHVLPGCTEPDCIAAAHLTDRRTRQAEKTLDAAYTAIFGPEQPQ